MKYTVLIFFLLMVSISVSAQMNICKKGQNQKLWAELDDNETVVIFKTRDIIVADNVKDKVQDVKDKDDIKLSEVDQRAFNLYKGLLKEDEAFCVLKTKYGIE